MQTKKKKKKLYKISQIVLEFRYLIIIHWNTYLVLITKKSSSVKFLTKDHVSDVKQGTPSLSPSLPDRPYPEIIETSCRGPTVTGH